MQDGQKPAVQPSDPTVEQAIQRTLGNLQRTFDKSLPKEDRDAAAAAYSDDFDLISTWASDPVLYGVGRKAADAIKYAELRMRRKNLIAKHGVDAVEAADAANFPARAQWVAELNQAAALDAANPGQADFIQTKPPSPEAAWEMLAAGDPLATNFLPGLPDLVDDDGKLAYGAQRHGAWRKVAEVLGVESPAIVLPDDLADMPAGFTDPERMLQRARTQAVLAGEIKQDGDRRYVEFQTPGGTLEQHEIPDLRALREFELELPDGTKVKTKLSDSDIEEIVQSREGGILGGTLFQGIQRMYEGKAATFYGDMLLPKITNNELLNRELMKDPAWQRAVMEIDRPQMWKWDAARATYGMAEFMGVMVGTGVVGRAIGAGAKMSAAAAASKFTSVAKYAPATKYLVEGGKVAARAVGGGTRAGIAAVRVPGTYFDARQIAEEVWYNAVQGVVNGQFEPGRWIQDGWNEGVAEFALGTAARGARIVGSKVLKSRFLDETRVGKWANSGTPAVDDMLEAGRLRAAKVGADASNSMYEHLVKRGIMDTAAPRVKKELLKAGFDTFVVGLGFGAYTAAHREAAERGDESISVGDFIRNLASADATASAMGMLFGHAMGLGVQSHRARDKGETGVNVWGLNVQLGAESVRTMNELAQFEHHTAEAALKDPVQAAAFMHVFDQLGDRDAENFEIVQNALTRQFAPDLVVPNVGAVGTLGKLVKLHQEDPSAFKDLLRFEDFDGLASVDTLLHTFDVQKRPDWAGPVRDMLGAVGDQVGKIADGEPYGDALSGQSMSERTRQVRQALKTAREMERGERRAAAAKAREERQAKEELNAERRTLLGMVQAKVKAGRKAERENARSWATQREVERKGMIEERKSRRTQAAKQRVAEIAATKDAKKKAALEKAHERAKADEKLQAERDERKAKRQAARDKLSEAAAARVEARKAKAAEKLAKEQPELPGLVSTSGSSVSPVEAKQEPEPGPVSGEEFQQALDDVNQLTVVPGFSSLDPAKGEVVDVALAGLVGATWSDLKHAAEDAKEQRAAADAKLPKARRLRPAKGGGAAAQPALPLPPAVAPSTPMAVMWTGNNQPYFFAGAAVLHPLADGTQDPPDVVLFNAASAGAFATFLANSKDPALAAHGRSHQQALALGVIMASADNEAVYDLAGALSGLTPQEIKGVVRSMRAYFPATKPHVDAVLGELAAQFGAPLITKAQLAKASTADLLALIASGAPVPARSSNTAIFTGNRGELLSKVTAKLGEAVERQTREIPMPGREKAAFAVAAAHLANLDRVLSKIPKKGLRIMGPAVELQRRVAYGATGRADTPLDTSVEGMPGQTVRTLSERLLKDLSAGQTEATKAATSVGTEEDAMPLGDSRGLSNALRSNAHQARLESTTMGPEVQAQFLLETQRRMDEVWALSPMGPEGITLLEVPETGELLVGEGIKGPELRRKEGEFLRGLVDGEQRITDILLHNFPRISQLQIEQMRERALKAQASAQELMRAFVRFMGMPHSQALGDRAVAELNHVFTAIELDNRGEKIEGEGRTVLMAAGWLEADGTLKADTPGLLAELANTSVLGGLRALSEDPGTPAEERESLVGPTKSIVERNADEAHVLFYSGTSSAEVRAAVMIAVDWVTGYYDRRLDAPNRAFYETFSVQSAWRAMFKTELSSSTAIDRLARGKNQTTTLARAGQFLLAIHQHYLAAPARGLGSASVKARNLRAQRVLAAGEAHAGKITYLGRMLSTRIVNMHLSSKESVFIGKLLSAGVRRSIKTEADWLRVFGPNTGHLYAIFAEVNELFSQIGEEAVQLGILDPGARDKLLNRYLPREWLRFVYGAKGNPIEAQESLSGAGYRQGSFEQQRMGETSKEDVRRIYDIAYVVPSSLVEASTRIRLFQVAHGLNAAGVFVSRGEFMAMKPWERAQYRRIALPGPGTKTGEAGLSSADKLKIRTRAMFPAEAMALELEERADTSIEQAMVFEFIQRERDSRGGEGQPAMTDRLADLLETMETGYTTINVGAQLSMLLDQTELGDSPNTSRLMDGVSRTAYEWRLLRTLYNPRHWTLQLGSNLISNAVLGKVPMWDILDPNGSYHTAADHQNRWQEAIGAGIDPAKSPDRQVRAFQKFVDLAGGHTWAQLVTMPITAADQKAQWLGDVARQMQASGLGLRGEVAQKFTEAVSRAGRAQAEAYKWVHELSNGAAPETRAEALRALHGLYAMQELFWKYAAYLEGRKLGMKHAEAFSWGAEGTGDFSDSNAFIRQFSTQYTTSRGDLYTAARVRVGKGAKIGEAGPNAGPLGRAWAMTEGLRMSGVGGPFWMYWAQMTPAYARAAVNHPWKLAAGMGMATFFIRLLSAAAGGEDDDTKEALFGRGSYLMAHADKEALEALARRYGDSPVSVLGVWKIAVRDWVKYTIAFGENTVHAASLGMIGEENAEAGMLFTAQGPQIGGRNTYFNLADFVMPLQTVQTMANLMHRVAMPVARGEGIDKQPFGGEARGLSDYGVAFLPSVIASIMAASTEIVQGVEGKSRGRVTGEHLARFASQWTTPMAGLPWIFSREGLQAIGSFAWYGRSTGEMIEGLPSDMLQESAGETLLGMGMRTLLPLRQVPNTSAVPSEGARGLFETMFDARIRPGTLGKDPVEVAGAQRASMTKEAILNVLSAARKNAKHYGAPPALWYAKALDITRDLVEAPTLGGMPMYSVHESPQSDLGKWIRSATSSEQERALLTTEMITQLRSHQTQLEAMLDEPRGVSHGEWLPVEIQDRMAAAIWERRTNPRMLLNQLHKMSKKPEQRGMALRLWTQLNMAEQVKDYTATDEKQRVQELTDTFAVMGGVLSPEYDPTPITQDDVRKVFKSKVYDLVPELALPSFLKD